jgi:hypothetical protein
MKVLAYLWTALIPIRQASAAKKERLGTFKGQAYKGQLGCKTEKACIYSMLRKGLTAIRQA